MDPVTFQVLLGHNPWLREKKAWRNTVVRHLPRRYVPRQLDSALECTADKVHLVIGPRQSGKSTLIWHFLAKQSQPFLLVNCEEPSCRALCRSPALFLNAVREITELLPGLFFEEVQHLPEAGLFLKGLADLKPGVPVFVTGSASYHLKSQTRESLAGRAIRHYLLPFGMAELWPAGQAPYITEEAADAQWKELLLWGGYPEVVLNRDKQVILARLVEAFVLRDASDIHKIKRPDAFRKLLSMAASQIGNLVNFSNWAENTGVSVNTVIEYVNLMAENHLVKLMPPFVGGKRAEVTSTPKIYFYDNGLRNLLFGGFAPENQRADCGALTENLVFSELCKNTNPLLDTIHYWRSSAGAEVDFVVRTTDALTAIEVKSGKTRRPKISRSLRSFIQAYRPDKVYVFNASLVDTVSVNGIKVRFERLVNLPFSIGKSKIDGGTAA